MEEVGYVIATHSGTEANISATNLTRKESARGRQGNASCKSERSRPQRRSWFLSSQCVVRSAAGGCFPGFHIKTRGWIAIYMSATVRHVFEMGKHQVHPRTLIRRAKNQCDTLQSAQVFSPGRGAPAKREFTAESLTRAKKTLSDGTSANRLLLKEVR